MLLDSAAKTYFLGVQVYIWGLYAVGGICLMLLTLLLQSHSKKLPRGTTPLMGCLMLPLGFLFSRLFYCLADTAMLQAFSLRAVLFVNGGGYSMFGALTGGVLGAYLAARILKCSVKELWDLITPALFLFIACERLGEGYIEDFGISRPLISEFLKNSFLSTKGQYDAYLTTSLLESFAALCLFFFSVHDASKHPLPGDTALAGLLLFGASQTLLESLRFDQHMKFSFVGVQQVMAFLCVCAVIIILALKFLRAHPKGKLAIFSLSFLPLLAGAVIYLEFLIDRSGISRLLLYILYAAVLFIPCVYGFQMRKDRALQARRKE